MISTSFYQPEGQRVLVEKTNHPDYPETLYFGLGQSQTMSIHLDPEGLSRLKQAIKVYESHQVESTTSQEEVE